MTSDHYEDESHGDVNLNLIAGGSPCSYKVSSGSPLSQRKKSGNRHSRNYRTLQTQSNGNSRPLTSTVVSTTSQRDLDLWKSKRWHTAPKEKHKASKNTYIVSGNWPGAMLSV